MSAGGKAHQGCKQRHRGKSERIAGMEQPFHQPRDAKTEHDSQRQYSICVLPNLFNRICKHQADASGPEAQEVNADDQSVIMDDLQIGVMGMDANGAVRQQNAHFRMSRRIPVVHIRSEASERSLFSMTYLK